MEGPRARADASPPRGRRRGGPDTRGQILRAAQRLFAERGYERATVRAVAAEAGVDAALVHHYFGGKEDLFVASLEIAVDPRRALDEVFEPGVEGAGRRLLTLVLEVWDQPDGRLPLVALLRSTLGERNQALLRDGFLLLVLTRIRGALSDGEEELRAELVATQMLGLVLSRYVLEIQPLASLPREEVVRLVAPTLQRYLNGPLRDESA